MSLQGGGRYVRGGGFNAYEVGTTIISKFVC